MEQAPIVVAMLLREQGTTGVQTHVRNLRDWLSAQGRPADLVTPFDAPAPLRIILYALILLRQLLERVWPAAAVLLYRSGHAWCLKRALRRRLAQGPAAVVYAQCPVSASVALGLPAGIRRPVALVVHFNESQADEWADKGAIARDGWAHRRISAFESRLLPSVDALVFVSRYMAEQVAQRHVVCSAVRQAVIPNFVSAPPQPECEAPDSSQADLIAIGTLEPRKNQRYLLEVLAAAQTRGRRLTLTLVGDGPDRRALEALSRQLGVDTLVRFAGFVRGGASLIHSHRAVVHAARMENLPLVLIEAMACGKPAFALPVGGIPELLRDGENGLLLPADDADAAAALICDCLDDPRRCAELARAARARFEAEFSADRIAASLEVFVRSAGAAPARPQPAEFA